MKFKFIIVAVVALSVACSCKKKQPEECRTVLIPVTDEVKKQYEMERSSIAAVREVAKIYPCLPTIGGTAKDEDVAAVIRKKNAVGDFAGRFENKTINLEGVGITDREFEQFIALARAAYRDGKADTLQIYVSGDFVSLEFIAREVPRTTVRKVLR